MLLSVILLFFQLWGNVEVSSSQIECLTLPDVPHANISEETKRIDYQGGHVIHFTCEPGYNTSGPTIRYVCTSEGWLAVQQESCSPRSCGHPGKAPFADFHLEKGDDFVFGSQVVYTCNKGYQMVSRTKYRRCMSEGWDGVVPVCEAQQCPVIHVEQNVQVIGDPEEATYGNVVQFSCKSRTEILSGSQEMYCDENGEWRGQIPTCKEITCAVPEIENGFVPGDIPEYKEEEVLHFRCDARYKPTVGRPSKCIKHGIRAEWSPTPACEPIRCRLTLPPQKGTRYQSPSRNVFLPGDTVRVMCGDKYWISHPWGTSVVTTCKEDGEWTFHPVCQEVVCSNQRPQHVYHWSVEWRQRMTLGETATYLCGTGYKKTDGATSAKCTRDGWNPNPLCQEITCNSQSYEEADIDGEVKTIYGYREQVHYTCKAGSEGRFTLTCEKAGWIGTPQCRTSLGCGTSPPLTDGDTTEALRFQHRHEERVHYRCQNYYTMEGEPYKTCINGEWIGRIRCLKPCTVDREAMRSHNIDFRYGSQDKLYLVHNDHVTFVCISNRKPVDTSGMRCQCVDGEMNLPTCQ
ncbi:complement factor H-like [Anarrhichthys ocellatus]|uniref:complement factor H-like n=1 Tax=Anarrhichthys ocellatus TaxID=433405 RepID=UPI0012EEBE33|nr:complement factor H-like [Anarrhichthys ocellatus]